ncbi:MAG: HIT domain-containing protein [Puniceicoccales bacterium]|jgi:ATP adenylyltransferase|nr:HIT domain-containing protein [Puniceicoccales bacterium]
MNHLHPYWRMSYVEAPKPPGGNAVFEEIPRVADDRSAHLLHRGQTGYLVLNRFPYNAGHLLAVPYRPVATLGGLDSAERAELMDLIVLAQDVLTAALSPDGFNVGFNFGAAAGAGIPRHLHAHVVPRWSGDNNFMPVVGETRVLVASLDAMWERLKAFCPG